MKKVVVEIEEISGLYCPQASVVSLRYSIGGVYAAPWSAKRGVRRFMKALGATNWRFADEPETEAEPAARGVHPWARWEATDASGAVWEYENEPIVSADAWIEPSPLGKVRSVGSGVQRRDWRNTLRRVNV